MNLVENLNEIRGLLDNYDMDGDRDHLDDLDYILEETQKLVESLKDMTPSLFNYAAETRRVLDKAEGPHKVSVKYDVGEDAPRSFAYGYEPGDVRV